MASNQRNVLFLLKKFLILSSQSVKTFYGENKPLVSEYYYTLERIVTSRCNDAVGNISRAEKFHRLAPRLSNIVLQRVGKVLLVDTMPNFSRQLLLLFDVME